MIGRATAVLALAGSAAAFAPMMSMDMGRREVAYVFTTSKNIIGFVDGRPDACHAMQIENERAARELNDNDVSLRVAQQHSASAITKCFRGRASEENRRGGSEVWSAILKAANTQQLSS